MNAALKFMPAAMLVCTAVFAGGCSGGADNSTMIDSVDSLPGVDIAVLQTVDAENDRIIDSVADLGEMARPRDLAVALVYLSKSRNMDDRARTIEVYECLRRVAPDSYGQIVYDVNREYERFNFGHMLDQQIEYQKSVTERAR